MLGLAAVVALSFLQVVHLIDLRDHPEETSAIGRSRTGSDRLGQDDVAPYVRRKVVFPAMFEPVMARPFASSFTEFVTWVVGIIAPSP